MIGTKLPRKSGTLKHREKEVRKKKGHTIWLWVKMGKPNFCFLNLLPISLPTVWLSVFSENVYQVLLSLFCIFSLTLPLLSVMLTLSFSIGES